MNLGQESQGLRLRWACCNFNGHLDGGATSTALARERTPNSCDEHCGPLITSELSLYCPRLAPGAEKERVRMRTFILGVCCAALFACTPTTPPSTGTAAQVAIATYPGGTIVTMSRTGRFVAEGRCLLFRDTSGRVILPVLRSGSSLVGNELSVAGSVNKRVVRVGERVVIEGDGQDWSNVPTSYQLSTYKNLCSVPPFFVVNAK